jgi:hypothetical protein
MISFSADRHWPGSSLIEPAAIPCSDVQLHSAVGDTTDVMGRPPRCEFAVACAQSRQQIDEGGIASPQIVRNLPYPWIMRMCPPGATGRSVGLIRAGLLRVDQFATTTFDLDQVNEAVVQAAENAGPFMMTVIKP